MVPFHDDEVFPRWILLSVAVGPSIRRVKPNVPDNVGGRFSLVGRRLSSLGEAAKEAAQQEWGPKTQDGTLQRFHLAKTGYHRAGAFPLYRLRKSCLSLGPGSEMRELFRGFAPCRGRGWRHPLSLYSSGKRPVSRPLSARGRNGVGGVYLKLPGSPQPKPGLVPGHRCSIIEVCKIRGEEGRFGYAQQA